MRLTAQPQGGGTGLRSDDTRVIISDSGRKKSVPVAFEGHFDIIDLEMNPFALSEV